MAREHVFSRIFPVLSGHGMTPLAARNGHRDSFRGKKKQHAGQRGMHCKNVVPHRGHGVTDITGGMG
jgi:hypothetical protein